MVLIVVGLYFIFLGAQLPRINSLIINCSILGLIIYSFLNLFVKVNMMLSMIFGVAFAIGVIYFETANGIVLGVIVGYLFGNLFYSIFMKIIAINPQTLYWGTVLSCILFISIAGGFMKTYMVCLATALVGSYSLVRVKFNLS